MNPDAQSYRRRSHLTGYRPAYPIRMNIKRAAATLSAVLILAGAPTFASSTETQTGPIHIDNVQFYEDTFSSTYENSTGFVLGSAAISFANKYDSPVTEIVFVLETNGYVVDRFDDVGSFAAGATITHAFAENQHGGDIRVAVEEAMFADGTVWQNPDVSQEPVPASVSVEARPRF